MAVLENIIYYETASPWKKLAPAIVPANNPPVQIPTYIEFGADPDPVLPTNHGLTPVYESMVPLALSSITNLSRVSNTTATNMAIAARVSGFIQGTLHCQKHVLEWIPYIEAHIPERTKAISLLYKISQVMDKTLIRAYSVGGFQARSNLVVRGQCIVERGSYNYAIMQWKEGKAQGFLRDASGALNQVLHLSKLLTHFFNNNTQDYEDIDGLLPKHSYAGKAPSHLLFQDASFLDHCVSLLNKIVSEERQVHSSKQEERRKDLLKNTTLKPNPKTPSPAQPPVVSAPAAIPTLTPSDLHLADNFLSSTQDKTAPKSEAPTPDWHRVSVCGYPSSFCSLHSASTQPPKPTLPNAAKTEQEKPVPPDSTEKPVKSPSQPMAWKEDLLDATTLKTGPKTPAQTPPPVVSAPAAIPTLTSDDIHPADNFLSSTLDKTAPKSEAPTPDWRRFSVYGFPSSFFSLHSASAHPNPTQSPKPAPPDLLESKTLKTSPKTPSGTTAGPQVQPSVGSAIISPMFQSSTSVSRVPSNDKDNITCLPGVAETSPRPASINLPSPVFEENEATYFQRKPSCSY